MMALLRAFGLGLLLMIVPALGLASVLSELALTVEPGTFVELEIDGDVSTCQAMIPPWPLMTDPETGKVIPRPSYLGNILEFTDEALWDPTGREVYIMGTRRPYKPWDQGFIKYSEETNSWTILDLPPFGIGAHGYDNGALDAQRREFYWSRIAAADNVWKLDLKLDKAEWERLPNAPIGAGEFSAIDFFPELDRLVFFAARSGGGTPFSDYALYHPETNKWGDPIDLTDNAPFGSISHFSEYNPSRSVMFFGGGYHYKGQNEPDPTPNIDESRRFYMLDSEQIVTRLEDAPTSLGQYSVGPIQTIDPNSGNLIVFQGQPDDRSCINDSSSLLPIWEYSLENRLWKQAGTQRLSDLWCRMNTVAVPLYEYGVNFIVSVRNENDCRVHLYRHKPAGDVALNISVQPMAVTVQQGEVATFSVIVVGSGPFSYQWRKNGVDINGATTASYSFTALDMVDNNAEFDVVVSNATESIISSAAALTIVVDTFAPTLQSIFAVNNALVDIVFSEAVSASSAQNNANYQIDLGIAVRSATLSEDSRTVSLVISPLTEDTTYTVSVSNVQDLAQSPNTIVALSGASFTYRTADGFEAGSADGWIPLTPTRWSVVMDEGDMAYYLNTSDFSNLEMGRLGEYSLLSTDFGDFTFTAQAKLGDDVANSALADHAVVFGFQDENNYYYAIFNNTQSATQLFKVVDGSRTELATAEIDWLSDNLYHSVEVSRIGSEIKVSFDDNLIMSTSDSTFGVGKVGVGSYNDSAYFDDVSVTGVISDKPDNTAPVITLAGDNPQMITVGSTYSESGASAMDNKDGDISANITVDTSAVDTTTIGSYSVNYNVSDAAGNAAVEVTRVVNVMAVDGIDDVAPMITLTGDNPQTIMVGSRYPELGATAMDNKDGDISATIIIDISAVDTTTVGSYSVTYNVSDAAGNAATQQVRTVNVVATTTVGNTDDPNDGDGGSGSFGVLLLLALLLMKYGFAFTRRPFAGLTDMKKRV